MSFKTLRILILLAILLMVAHNQFITRERFASWDAPVFVAIYPVNADGSDETADYIRRLTDAEFQPLIQFAAREAERYGLDLRRPFYLELGEPVTDTPPAPPVGGTFLARAAWILKARWWRWRFDDQGLDPDILVLARYHDPKQHRRLPHSTGVEDLRIAIANVFATRDMRGANNVVILHEMMHTIGATDKYDLDSGLPIHPHGYAEPDRTPRYPQPLAELMAGRIPVSPTQARQASTFGQVIIGPETASEIGWPSLRR